MIKKRIKNKFSYIITIFLIIPIFFNVSINAADDYVSSLNIENGKIIVEGSNGYYVGYSADYSKRSDSNISQIKEESQTIISQRLNLSESDISRLRMLLAFSPAGHWQQVQEDWPNINVNQGVEDPKTWSGDDLKKADVYFQYVFWGYIAKMKNDEVNFKNLQPEAFTFLEQNPKLVEFYSSGTLDFNAFLDNINPVITDYAYSQGHAGESYGPFSISSDLSSIQKTQVEFDLSKLTERTEPLANSNYYKFIDENGLEISKVKDGQLFYIKISDDAYNGYIEFSASTNDIVSPLFMNNVLFKSETNSDIFAVAFSADDNLMKNETNIKVNIVGYEVDNSYVTGYHLEDGKVDVSNPSIAYGGYSLDFTKTNRDSTIEAKIDNESEIINKTGLTSSQINDLTTMISYSPAIIWDTVKEDWPNININGSSIDLKTLNEQEQKKANVYFQYVLWYYVATYKGEELAFQTQKPEAYEFIQNNPELVKFYDINSMIYDTLDVNTITTINSPAVIKVDAGQKVGPFTVTSNLPDYKKATVLYDLVAPTFNTYPTINASLFKFIDKDGNIITKVKENQEFYLQISSKAYSGAINFSAINPLALESVSKSKVLFTNENDANVLAIPYLDPNSIVYSNDSAKVEIVGQTSGRYTYSERGKQYGFQVVDSLDPSLMYQSLCAEKNVYVIRGVGYNNVLTNPQEIANEMEISLESLYRLRYIFSQSAIYTKEFQSFIGKYPSTFKNVTANGTETFRFDSSSINDSKVYEKMYRAVQIAFWYAEDKETNNPRYSLPTYEAKTAELNSEFIKFFYDPTDSSKSLKDIDDSSKEQVSIDASLSVISNDGFKKTIGPYKVNSSTDDTFDLSLSNVPANVNIEIVNEAKSTIKTISNNEKFYILVDSTSESGGEIKLNAKSHNEYLTGYDEKYFMSDYSQNMYTLSPINEKIESVQTVSWTSNVYNLSFDDNGGYGNKMPDDSYYIGEKKKLPKNTYSKKGYKFKGWSTAPEGKVEYTDEAFYTFDSTNDVTLYAVWEKENTNSQDESNQKNDISNNNIPSTGYNPSLLIIITLITIIGSIGIFRNSNRL